jgi:hypothetical protein
MRDDPEFGKRITKKVQEIKKDKESLLNIADQYGERYQQEIVEGTLHRANLLTEGKSRGLSEDEVMSQYGRFVPTVYTPILNLLYFLLRESELPGQNKYGRRDNIDQQLLKANMLEHKDEDITERDIDSLLDELEQSIYKTTKSEAKRTQLNERFAEEKKTVSKEDATKLKDTPDMVSYLYGNITLDTFNKIKKLKALSKSPNEKEAFLAYRKAMDLCKEYNLDFDRIPCYVKGQENG